MEIIKSAQLKTNDTSLIIPQFSKSVNNAVMLIAISYLGLLICVGFIVLMAWLGGIPVTL